MAGDRRVKLVFAAELGRRLLRTRGFSRCWFLLPARARLVGDVAHAIRAEFGLEESASVELRLEQLLLLPTHDARILRDHDELLVQSAHAPLSIESDGDEERKAKKLRKQQRKETKRQQQKKKSDDRRVRTAASRKRSVSSAVSDSDSSSSSSDLEIEEVVAAKEKKQKEKSSRPTHKRQRLDPGATTTVSAPVTAQKSAGGSTEPKQRRRRRQRNRKPREASANGAKELGAPPPTPSAPPAAADSEQQLSVAHEDLRSAATRGHLRFGDAGEARAVSSADSGAGARHARTQRAFVSPELQKYGPSASTASSSEQQQQQQQPSNGQLQHRQHSQHQRPARIPNSSDVAPDHHTSAKKAKVKYGTMWKRPYEIVATILDASSNSTVAAVPRKVCSQLALVVLLPTLTDSHRSSCHPPRTSRTF